MSSIVRNIGLYVLVGFGTGGVTAALFPQIGVTPTQTGGSSGAVQGGAVISNTQTSCDVANSDTATATTQWRQLVLQQRQNLNLPVQVDTNLNDLAAGDILAMNTGHYVGTVNPFGQTIVQRIQALVPTATAGSEIIIKGCFGTNSPQEIMQLINSNSAAQAILAQSNWTHMGVGVASYPGTSGIYWVLIFAQE